MKVVLAYSGGLDTSVILHWIKETYEADVVTYTGDVGQGADEVADARRAAQEAGASEIVVDDLRDAFVREHVFPALRANAAYEGSYLMGTCLARPVLARGLVQTAERLGADAIAHGATGKGNDQIRFEFAYRSLAPECPVLAPWKTWEFGGRKDLVDYLRSKGYEDRYEVTKDFSLDENLWHLSIEGGPLEDATACLDVERILENVADRFGGAKGGGKGPASVAITLENGVPVALDGQAMPLADVVSRLNVTYRHAVWAWDVVIENRYTGIKSRGVYINPAAKVLQSAADALARTCLNKPMYDRYVEVGGAYGTLLYRGEYFSDQRALVESSARELMSRLNGTVTMQLEPQPYAAQILAAQPMFRKDIATFERSSDYSHQDAEGFIRLAWLSTIGRSSTEGAYADPVETGINVASDVCGNQPMPAGGLVSSEA